MQQLFELFLKTGLRPFAFVTDTAHIEQRMTRSDLMTLIILSYRGSLAMSELASVMGAPLSSMTSIAKRLERKGCIARRTSPHDQRITLVALTPEGQSIAKEWETIMQRLLGRLEDALTPQELETFVALSLKVAKVMQEDMDDRPAADERPAAPRSIPVED